MKYFVYMVRCSDKSLYTGITTDVMRRVREHNGEGKKGAKYTATRQPVFLVYSVKYENRSKASQEESRIKKLSKTQKESLLDESRSQLTP